MAEAEVHILNHGDDSCDMGRLVQTLARALQDGQDLGPRGPHIRASGHALEQLHQKMLRAAEALPIDPGLRAQIDRLSQAIERLTAVASTY